MNKFFMALATVFVLALCACSVSEDPKGSEGTSNTQTPTPTVTFTPTAAPLGYAHVSAGVDLPIYNQFGAQEGTMPKGATYEVISESTDGMYLEVVYPGGKGWVSSSPALVSASEIPNGIQSVQYPLPTATPMPSTTPMPTATFEATATVVPQIAAAQISDGQLTLIINILRAISQTGLLYGFVDESQETYDARVLALNLIWDNVPAQNRWGKAATTGLVEVNLPDNSICWGADYGSTGNELTAQNIHFFWNGGIFRSQEGGRCMWALPNFATLTEALWAAASTFNPEPIEDKAATQVAAFNFLWEQTSEEFRWGQEGDVFFNMPREGACIGSISETATGAISITAITHVFPSGGVFRSSQGGRCIGN